MGRISAATVRHYPHLFVGMFVALSLGVALVGVTARAIFAAVSAPASTVGQALTLPAGNGSVWTVRDTPDDMGALISVLGLGATVSAFVTVMVVAGAVALSVSLRRRDIGLLRMAGAGKGTVRRLVLAEALVVAVPAAMVGSVIVIAASGPAFATLNRTSLADIDITPGPLLLPLAVAVGSGLLLAVLGALAGSGTATRTRPHAALQEANLDSGGMTFTRTAAGILFLGAGGVMVGLTFTMDDDSATPVAIFGTIFLAIGLTAFAPVFVPPLLRLCMVSLRVADPVPGRLAATSVGTARRRTSSLVAPVLGVLTVVGIFATVLATSAAGAREDLVARDAAQLQVTAQDGLSTADLHTIRSTPGVAIVTAPVPVDVALAGTFDVTVQNAAAVDLPALAQTNRFDLVEGRLAPLKPNEVAISSENASWEGWHAGDQIHYGVFGGQVKTARIAAIINAGLTLPPVILPEGSVDIRPTTARIQLGKGASADRVERELRTALAARHAAISASRSTTAAEQEQQDHINWIALLILAAPASGYAIIGIASTILMATSLRRSDVSTMTRLGLSHGQVLRTAFWEALATNLIGIILAAALVAFGSFAFRASVPVYHGTATLSIPWSLLATLAGGCLVTSLAASLIATTHLLRSRQPNTTG